MFIKSLLAGMVLVAASASALAQAAEKIVIAHRGAAAIYRNIPCLPRRWLMLREPITSSRIW